MLHYARVKHNIPGNKTYFTKPVLYDLKKFTDWSARVLHTIVSSYILWTLDFPYLK